MAQDAQKPTQDTQSQQFVPGSDVLKDTLRRSRLTDDQRSMIWKAYQTPGDQDAFKGALRNLDTSDDVRDTLWSMRYKGFKNLPTTPAQPSPDTQMAAAPPAQAAKGDVRPTNKDVLQGFLNPQSVGKGQSSATLDPSQIGMKPPVPTNPAYGMRDMTQIPINQFTGQYTPDKRIDPSQLKGIGNPSLRQPNKPDLMAAFAAPGTFLDPSKIRESGPQNAAERANPDLVALRLFHTRPLMDVGVAVGANDPVTKGTARFLTGMTTPESLAFVGAGGMFEGLPAAGRAAVSSIFGTQMAAGLYQQSPEFAKAARQGNWDKAAEIGSEMIPEAAMTFLTGLHATKETLRAVGDALINEKTPTETNVDQKRGQAKVTPRSQQALEEDFNTRLSQAKQAQNTSTSKGPISETGGQQLPLDFTTKPPTEAHAPVRTDGASKSGSVPVIDKQALIAPEPVVEDPAGGSLIRPEVRARAEAESGKTGMTDAEVDTWGRRQKAVAVSLPMPKLEDPKPAAPVVRDIPNLVQQLHGNFDRLADLNRQQDLAESDKLADDIGNKRRFLEDQTRGVLAQDMKNWKGEDVQAFRDQSTREAERSEAQSKAIKTKTENTIKNRGIHEEITDLLAPGGPVREGVIDPLTGERGVFKPQEKVGPATRSVLNTLRGRVPTHDLGDIEITGLPDGVNKEEGAAFIAKLQSEKTRLVRKISDAVQIAHDTGSSLADQGIEEHASALKEIDSQLGKYTKKLEKKADGSLKPAGVGARPGIPAELDEQGAIKPRGTLDRWTTSDLQKVFGKKYDRMPADEELFQEADMRQEKGRLFRGVADAAQAELDSRKPVEREPERGAVGEPLRGKVQPVSLMAPSVDDFIGRVKKFGTLVRNQMGDLINTHRGDSNIAVSRVTPETTEGTAGFLAVDSRGATHFIDSRLRGTWDNAMHDEIAEAAYPHLADPMSSKALKSVLDNPDIARKARPGLYEFNNTRNPRILKAVELDIIKDRLSNRPVEIDTRDNPFGKTMPLTIEPGWEDFGKAVEKAKLRQGWTQRGASLLPNLASGAAGMAAGAKIGATIGGGVGAAIGAPAGFIVGFMAPEVFRSARVQAALPAIKNFVQISGISAKQWFNGTPQLEYPSPQLKLIEAEQRMHENRSTTWLERAKTLPAQIAKGFDPFIYVADKNNMGNLSRALMSLDKAGKVFRDLTLPDTRSLYMALRDAKGRALGQRWYQQMQYNDIKVDARKAGLADSLTKYLNLKAYQRGFDVLDEHMQDLQKRMQDTQQALQDPNNTVRENIAHQDKLKELQKYHDELDDKVQSGKAMPGGYTPQTLQAEFQNMQQWAGLNNWTKLNSLSDRVFQSRVHILDMLHDNGLVTDEAYQKYKGRGPEYVPLERIMDDLADNKFHSSTQPLHLRQQTVIKTLEGSERTNVNPWEAFAHADAKAFNQILRNDTMRHAVDLKTAYPQDIGKEFKEVGPDYRPKKGEAIVGHYEGGKPQLYAVPEYLGDALQTYPGATKTALGAYASWWGHQFKRGATIANLSFQAASLLGHAGAGLVLSESNRSDVGRFAANWGRSVKSVLSQDMEFREMVRSGAAFGGWQQALDPEYFASPSDIGIGQKIKSRHFLEAAQDAAAMLENINRVNTWRNARLDGHSERSSSFEAKYRSGAPDFSRMGDMSQPLNQVFMFVNASMQYTSQMMDAIRKDPKRIGGVLVATAATAVALQAWNAQQKDSEGNSLLRKVPIEERLRNWTVLLPWTYKDKTTGAERAYQVNIPKPYVAQFMVNPVEAAASNIIGKEDRTGTQQALDVLGHMTPIRLHMQEGNIGSSLATSVASAVHPVVKTAIQQFANKDDFGYPVVPQSQQGIDTQFQYGPRTTAPAKAIGQGGGLGALAGGVLGGAVGGLMAGKEGAAIGGGIGMTIGARGASPRRVEAGVRSMFASSAAQTESYLNPFFEAATNTKAPQTAMEKARSAPVVGPMITRFTGSQMDQQMATASQQFYNAANQAKIPLATVEYLQKNLPDQALGYLNKHRGELEKGFLAQTMESRLQEVDGALKQVQGNTNMKPEDQAALVERLYKLKMHVLDLGNKALGSSPQVGQAAAFPGQGQGAPR